MLSHNIILCKSLTEMTAKNNSWGLKAAGS